MTAPRPLELFLHLASGAWTSVVFRFSSCLTGSSSPSPLLVHPHFPVPRPWGTPALSPTLTSCVISHWIEVLLLVTLKFRSLGQWFSPGGMVLTTFGSGGDILGCSKLVGCGGGGSAVGSISWEEVRDAAQHPPVQTNPTAERSRFRVSVGSRLRTPGPGWPSFLSFRRLSQYVALCMSWIPQT